MRETFRKWLYATWGHWYERNVQGMGVGNLRTLV